jgi:hypothetical protein
MNSTSLIEFNYDKNHNTYRNKYIGNKVSVSAMSTDIVQDIFHPSKYFAI